jgi:hypothetical protein
MKKDIKLFSLRFYAKLGAPTYFSAVTFSQMWNTGMRQDLRFFVDGGCLFGFFVLFEKHEKERSRSF